MGKSKNFTTKWSAHLQKLILGGLLFLTLINCQNEQKQLPKNALPNTPESVSKQWQQHLDNNEIEKVAALSTPSTKEWLTENRDIFLNDTQSYKTEFLKMNCQIKGDTATCQFTIREEGEIIDDYFLLKKINGQWLVDIEEDTDIPSLEEQLFREMEKELKLKEK